MTREDLEALGVTAEQAGRIFALLERAPAEAGMPTESAAPCFAGPVGAAAPRLTGAQFAAMGYRERARLYEQDPKQYQMMKEQ